MLAFPLHFPLPEPGLRVTGGVCVSGMVHLSWGHVAPNTEGGLLDQFWGLFNSFIHSAEMH